MSTADLIASHLGERWWEREHDGTAILSLLDRLMEWHGMRLEEAHMTILHVLQLRMWAPGVNLDALSRAVIKIATQLSDAEKTAGLALDWSNR